MRSWMIAFSIGIFLAGFIPSLPAGGACLLFLLPFFASLVYRPLRLTGAFFLGICWFLWWAHGLQRDLLPSELERQDIWVRGTVAEMPQRGADSQRFAFRVSAWCPTTPRLSACTFQKREGGKWKILLSLYEAEAAEVVKPGERWQWKVRLIRPHGFANPGGFDYEAWLLQRGFGATGYARTDPGNGRLAEQGILPSIPMERLRWLFQRGLDELELRRAAFIKALTIGDRYDISDRDWQLLTVTGTNHLLVISGLHVGLTALLVYRFGLLALSLLPGLLHHAPTQRVGAALAVLSAFFYAGLAGFSLPTQRALIMVCCFMGGQLCCRQSASSNSFCLAMALVLALDPLAPQGTGFWLSFLAVAVLLLLIRQRQAMEGELSMGEKAKLLLKTQFYLFVGMLPLMLLFFQQASLLAPGVNLLAIPYISTLVVPLCLLGLLLSFVFPPWSGLAVKAADLLLDWYCLSLEWIALHLHFLRLDLPVLPAGLYFLLVGLALLFLLAPKRAVKGLALLAMIPVLLSKPAPRAHGEFTLDILDVGQGLAAVVTTRTHQLVYDSGPAYSPRFNAGSGVIHPFLRARNIHSPERIVISHGDRDHAGGLEALQSLYPQAIYQGGEPAAEASPPMFRCRQGQSWRWDGVHFQILHPDRAGYEGNNSSCVLKISSGGHAALLTGDIESSVERRLLASRREQLAAAVLIAPHHGSKTSSNTAFINAVAPRYAVFSSGYRNHFNHPHEDIVRRYEVRGVSTLNTAETGNIHFLFSPEDGVASPALYRQQRRRFWTAWD